MSFGTASVNNQQKTSANDLNQGAKVGLDTSGAASGKGFDFLNHAATTLDDPAQYYHSILAGGSSADAALAPDINRTRAAAGQSQQAAETLAPRGGGRGSVLFSQPQQENSQIQSIFNTARPAAAEGATRVGATQGSVGTGTLGTGSGYLNAANSAASSGFDAGTTQYKQQQQAGSAFGSTALGLASLIPGVGGFVSALAPLLKA